MSNYAIVSNEVVTNVVVWDGDTEAWKPSDGEIAIAVTDSTGCAYIGGTFNGSVFLPPPEEK